MKLGMMPRGKGQRSCFLGRTQGVALELDTVRTVEDDSIVFASVGQSRKVLAGLEWRAVS